MAVQSGPETAIIVEEGGHFSADEAFCICMFAGAESSTKGNQETKVPEKFRNHDEKQYKEYFDVNAVPIGPYHLDEDRFKEVEKLKIEMAKQYAGTFSKCRELYNKVSKVADVARRYYDESSLSSYDIKKFTRMMFLDGCFILQFISLLVQEEYHKMGMTNNVIADVKRDLFLLENQLPYIVLKELMGKNSEKDVEDGKIMIGDFIRICRRLPSSVGLQWFFRFVIIPWLSEREGAPQATDPHHLLDLTRTRIVDPDAIQQDEKGKKTEWYSYYSAKVLKSKGINFCRNTTGSYSDVKFSSIIRGELTLPPIFIDTSTSSFLLNLAAFEANSHDLRAGGITSYICFMDSLIDNAEDVMILRSQNVIVNCLGSDELAADMFNNIAKNLVPDPNAYAEAKIGIQRHCNSKFKKWMAECLQTHCRSPWTLLALFGALFAIILTVAQTYLAAKPPKT